MIDDEKFFDDLLKHLKSKVGQRGETDDAVELNADHVIEFGTYRGVKLREVPADYLRGTGLSWSNQVMRGRVEVELVRRAQQKAKEK